MLTSYFMADIAAQKYHLGLHDSLRDAHTHTHAHTRRRVALRRKSSFSRLFTEVVQRNIDAHKDARARTHIHVL